MSGAGMMDGRRGKDTLAERCWAAFGHGRHMAPAYGMVLVLVSMYSVCAFFIEDDELRSGVLWIGRMLFLTGAVILAGSAVWLAAFLAVGYLARKARK